MDDMPMYRKTPKSTAIGTSRNKGAMTTEQPTITDTNKELTLCSKLKKAPHTHIYIIIRSGLYKFV